MIVRTILVVAATGNQGYAVATQLIQRGHKVHAMVRSTSSEKAKQLSSLGATLHVGDLAVRDSILSAMDNIEGVFVALPTSPMHEEVTYIQNIVKAAQARQLKHFIFSSVARTGDHESFPGWSDHYPMAWYWKDKHNAETLVRTSEFEYWTILRPASFIQNFCQPLCDFLFPALAPEHKLQLAYHPDTRLDLIHTDDIGVFAASAFESPDEFNGKAIGLASESLTPSEIAATLSRISGVEISVELLNDGQAVALKDQGPGLKLMMDAQIWHRDIGYQVDIESLRQYGIPLKHLADLKKNDLGW